jgi:hypothetical protein
VVEEEWVGEYPARERQGGGTISYHGIHWWPVPAAANLDASIPPEVVGAVSPRVYAA